MRQHRSAVLGATLLALALVLAACGSGGDGDTGGGGDGEPKGTVTVGVSGAFAENQLVAEMYALVLENAGYTVERQLDLGTREISDQALFSGEIDVKPEYLGFEIPALDPDASAEGTSDEVASVLEGLLADKDVELLAHSPANSTNAFVVTPETAQELGLQTVSDLAPVAGDLTLGGPPECPERPFCAVGLKDVYGVEFKDFKALDFGGPQTAAALKSGAIDVALLFSLDPTIEDNGWISLEDDKNLQVAGNFAAVIRNDVVNDEIRGLLNSVTESLTTEGMLGLVGQVVLEQRDVADVAQEYLQEQGLL